MFFLLSSLKNTIKFNTKFTIGLLNSIKEWIEKSKCTQQLVVVFIELHTVLEYLNHHLQCKDEYMQKTFKQIKGIDLL